ncbi:hypothetical protein DV738_g1923, partial [Chaetothyriales sp. CBS 135597]
WGFLLEKARSARDAYLLSLWGIAAHLLLTFDLIFTPFKYVDYREAATAADLAEAQATELAKQLKEEREKVAALRMSNMAMLLMSNMAMMLMPLVVYIALARLTTKTSGYWALLSHSYDEYIQAKICDKFKSQILGEAKIEKKTWTNANIKKLREEETKRNPDGGIDEGRLPSVVTRRLFSGRTMASHGPSKLHGRAFYQSLGSPKLILAPMVDRSEIAWRLLTRSYLEEEAQSRSLLAYTPMFHGRLFGEHVSVRDEHFQPTRGSLVSKEKSDEPAWLDGNPDIDRPLFVQFCANKPDELLEAAQYVAPYCDAVDLNLGCPQGIARSGRYGSFLQDDWETIYALINKLHTELSVPVTAKMRILDTRERTLEYAKMILSAGASILAVHGRRREQKSHNTGVADWSIIKYLRDNLPPETVLFANGNILNFDDIDVCIAETGVDGVMSAEGNLSNPAIFAGPPTDLESREYWRGKDGKDGYRLDGVFRRYLDIIYRHILEQTPPERPPLYLPGDEVVTEYYETSALEGSVSQSRKNKRTASPSLRVMQGHLFSLLRHIVSTHPEIRDALSRTTVGNMAAFEKVLRMLEAAIKQALDEQAANLSKDASESTENKSPDQELREKYKRPWWVCQPFIRPLPPTACERAPKQLNKTPQNDPSVPPGRDQSRHDCGLINEAAREQVLACG